MSTTPYYADDAVGEVKREAPKLALESLRKRGERLRAAQRGQRQAGSPNDHRCTPAAIWMPALGALGGPQRWSLDVASNAHSTVPAALSCYEGGPDGLVVPWAGHVWCNPPFSAMATWVARAVEQSNLRGSPLLSVTLLGPADMSTAWCQDALRWCDAFASPPKRHHFPVPGQAKEAPPAGVLLFYRGPGSTAWRRSLAALGWLAMPGVA